MLCRLQCARFAIRWRIADALPSSPRHSHGRRRLSRGGKPPVKVWLGGSTPNEITSCQAASRSKFSLFRLRKRYIIFKDVPNKGASCIRVPQSRRKAARMRLWARNFVMILRGGGAADSLHISKAHPHKSAQKIRSQVLSSRFSSVFTEKAPERIVLGRFRAAFRRLYSNFSTEMPASAKSLPANSSG